MKKVKCIKVLVKYISSGMQVFKGEINSKEFVNFLANKVKTIKIYKMKKVLWLSRHAMSIAQRESLIEKLGEIEVTQVNGTITNVHVPFEGVNPENGETCADIISVGTHPPLKELVAKYDEVAVVLSIGMLQQLLPFSPSKRLLQAKNKRILLEEGKVQFVFDGWEAIKEIKIITEML